MKGQKKEREEERRYCVAEELMEKGQYMGYRGYSGCQ